MNTEIANGKLWKIETAKGAKLKVRGHDYAAARARALRIMAANDRPVTIALID
jgi:hypothetical protein